MSNFMGLGGALILSGGLVVWSNGFGHLLPRAADSCGAAACPAPWPREPIALIVVNEASLRCASPLQRMVEYPQS
jgi:hypothetical protein